MMLGDDRVARVDRIRTTIRPDQDREAALAHIDLITKDEAGLAALELWVDRVGALPPCKVTPQDRDRLYADAEGKAAVRLLNGFMDSGGDQRA